jgi:CO/xanthine dehydrogenase Mo-binding subunit
MNGRRALLLSRRAFLRTGALAGTALVIGCRIPGRGESAAAAAKHALNAWVTIDTAGQVTVWLGKSEMGQGVRTSLPMIVAEELGVEWAAVGVEQALSNPKVYGSQGTGGSSSVRRSIQPLRKAGAAAREMLIAAAAQSWGVSLGECRAEKGMVLHEGSRRKAPYGELVEAASKLPVPENPRLKEPKDFRIIGTRTPRLDTPSKVDGSAVYGIDFRVPGMLFAAVARAPVFGAKVVSFDAARAKAVPGVRDVVQIDTGVAVVADTTWSAFQGREALEIRWEKGPHAGLDSAAIQRKFEQMTVRSGATARREGDAAGALARSARRVEAVYELPYLAHAPMEPMNCTAHVRADLCEIWAPTQVPNEVQETGATITGLPAEAVRVHTTLLGGGFGRRLESDDAAEAVKVSKAIGGPVKVVWSREDDMRHGFLRPASRHRLRGGLDREGRPIAWQHRTIFRTGFRTFSSTM